MGLDIVSVKNQLSYADIVTTMMYLHITKSYPKAGFAPMEKPLSRAQVLDLLFGERSLLKCNGAAAENLNCLKHGGKQRAPTVDVREGIC